jgi:hypothetical protein
LPQLVGNVVGKVPRRAWTRGVRLRVVGRVVVQRSAPGQLLLGLFVDTAHDINEIGNFRGPRGDRPVERDGFVLGDGSEPFEHLEVAAAGQTTVREQYWDLASVRGLPVQRCGIRAGRVERADPRGRRAVRRAERDRPVAGTARRPRRREKRSFHVPVIGLPAQRAKRLTVWARILRGHSSSVGDRR